MLKACMATRNLSNVKKGLITGTEFQLHKSHRTIFTGILHKVIDYTEYRLERYAAVVTDPQQKSMLADLIDKYRKGAVAIAWRGGTPVWLPVTKDV